jgi:hypothetical protein
MKLQLRPPNDHSPLHFSHHRSLWQLPANYAGGIYLQFTSDTESAMVLEYSTDLRFWTPVTSMGRATSLDHLLPKAALGSCGFLSAPAPSPLKSYDQEHRIFTIRAL